MVHRKPLFNGRIQEFQIEGAQKYYAHALHIASAKRKVPYAVVTPLRKAASYEQRKTNLGNSKLVPRNCNVLSRSATYYAALTWQNFEHFEISLHFPEGVT